MEEIMLANLSNRSKIILQLLFVLALIGAAIIFVMNMINTRPVAGSRAVNFRVEASGGFAIVTLQAGPLVIKKPTTVSTTWTKQINLPGGTEVYLTASNPTQTGKLTCTIFLDNVTWKAETTTAPKDGVACAGIVP